MDFFALSLFSMLFRLFYANVTLRFEMAVFLEASYGLFYGMQ